MHFLSYYFGISKQTEVLLLTLIGICCLVFDKSHLYVNSNLLQVWNLKLDPISFSPFSHIFIKYILSGIILVRSFTIYVYLVFYIMMLWPAIFEERPVLLLPWLLTSVVISLLTSSVTVAVGLYTCVFSNFQKSACLNFFFTQLLDKWPSFYMWFCVFSYYRELKTANTVCIAPTIKSTFNNDELTLRRRKVRSLTKNSNLKRLMALEEERPLISVSIIENLVQKLRRRLPKYTRSLDTLLASMAAKAALKRILEETRSEIAGKTMKEKAKKILKLTDSEITNAKFRKSFNHNEIFLESIVLIYDLDEKNTNFGEKTKHLCLPSLRDEIQTNELKSNMIITMEQLADVSEIEIRPVLNYSTSSLSTVKEALYLSDGVIEKNIEQKILDVSKSLIPVRVPYYTTPVLSCNVDVANQTRNDMIKVCSTTQYPSEVKLQNTFHRCDFSCQVSTLSRNILKLTNFELVKSCLYKTHGVLTNESRKVSIGLQKTY